jgi:hypothetical protein
MKGGILVLAAMAIIMAGPARAAPPSVARAHLENSCRALGEALEEARAAARAGGLPLDWEAMLGDLSYVWENVCLAARPGRPRTGRAYNAAPRRERLERGVRSLLMEE